MKHFIQWSHRKYSLPVRMIATLCAGLLFAVLIPLTLARYLPGLDARLGIPSLYFGSINVIIGSICIVFGGFYGFWSIGDQLFGAQGTPLPVMATQKLLVSGPFKQCRNPMGFGAIIAYFGISLIVGSVCSIAGVVLFALLLVTYIKQFEEKELEIRFGEEYRIYKSTTPFFIPRIFS
jgi:protein-S-isoprenylcysteine O-methyltransferase Ste14